METRETETMWKVKENLKKAIISIFREHRDYSTSMKWEEDLMEKEKKIQSPKELLEVKDKIDVI